MTNAVIVDTSFLYAVADRTDRHHQNALELSSVGLGKIILPITVLPEICYLLDSRLGHQAMRQSLSNVLLSGIDIEQITEADLQRTLSILTEYADARVDFVDATVMALAERLNVTRILTLDQRHFRLFRPRHCPAFELLP